MCSVVAESCSVCLYHVLCVCSIPILHSHSSGIIEEGGSREHSFGVITPERTYHLTAESETDKRYRHPHTLSHSHPSPSHFLHSYLDTLFHPFYPSHPHPSHPHLSPLSPPFFREWCEIIRHVRTLPEQKVKSLLVQEVDPAKAIMTIDLELIDSVTATDQEKK